MTRGLYVIRDRVAEYCGPTFQARNENDAVRQFVQALGSKGTTLNENPQDFELINVGHQDEATGTITPCYDRITNGHTLMGMKAATEAADLQVQVH